MTRAEDYDFDSDAVKDVADVFENAEMEPGEETTVRQSSTLLFELGAVCDNYGVRGADERVELIMAGADYYVERSKQEMLSDLREMLEALSQFWANSECEE